MSDEQNVAPRAVKRPGRDRSHGPDHMSDTQTQLVSHIFPKKATYLVVPLDSISPVLIIFNKLSIILK
jgi:hypothetical protein